MNDKTYANGCFAYIDGYSECEYYGGECSTSTSETNHVLPIFYPNPSHRSFLYARPKHNLYNLNKHKMVRVSHS
ncbi:MAG: hypothetical protein IPN86_24155 [Saprospiraceae bacterium]|nr:hypothetical protein [Saprospiraceae bacterium]